MLSAGIKEKKPVELGDTDPSIKTNKELGKLYVVKSLNKDWTRLWGRQCNIFYM